MWALLLVIVNPQLRSFLNLQQALKHIYIQHSLAVAAVKRSIKPFRGAIRISLVYEEDYRNK